MIQYYEPTLNHTANRQEQDMNKQTLLIIYKQGCKHAFRYLPSPLESVNIDSGKSTDSYRAPLPQITTSAV